ncbi:OmpP1/FadL family transporter [Marinoscillum sp. MHG1-6]|uniref:OmpP1/FadL family transporter n=1 Tax=Marinoscillum sp. MHG1-6 TaxID=2959627 RepID=UPI0021580339|nr:long-chain fatty acid transporter [Marinoscillum sp. MHG1-6]
MKSLSIILIGGLALFGLKGFGQPYGYYQDALRFSQTNPFGSTARIQALGGSQIALGGDISSAGSNPAGLGFFNRSVFSFTPTVTFHNSDGNYGGEIIPSYQPNFNLPNFGIVLNHTIGDIPEDKFKGGSFAISFTRINDFNQVSNYGGYSPQSSIVDAFLSNSGTIAPGNLSEMEYAAYYTYLTDPFYDGGGNLTEYQTYVGVEPYQTEKIITSGGQNQLNFSWGGNYNDKVYFGAGLGVQTLNFKRSRYYYEDDFIYYVDGTAYDDDRINSLYLSDEYTINGAGINGTFGLILRPISVLTMGISYTTPTYLALRDESSFIMDVDWNNFAYDDSTILDQESYVSDITVSDYNLRTPSKLSVGAAFFLGKLGFITGDVEYVDYSSAQFQSNTPELNMNADNQEIINLYRNTLNYRLGAEVRMDIFRFRAGYAYTADPYRDAEFDRSRQNLTLGVGIRKKNFYTDLAVVNTLYKDIYSPYYLPDNSQPQVQFDNQNTAISATVGFTF